MRGGLDDHDERISLAIDFAYGEPSKREAVPELREKDDEDGNGSRMHDLQSAETGFLRDWEDSVL